MQLVISQIPSSVDTVEKLASWAISALAQANPTSQVATAPGQQEPTVTAQTFRYINQGTDQERLVCIAYLPLEPGWRSVGKIYSGGIKEISGAALPSDFAVA